VRLVSSSFWNCSVIYSLYSHNTYFELHNRFKNTRDEPDEKSAEDVEYMELCRAVQMLTRAYDDADTEGWGVRWSEQIMPVKM
jgi:hypothetical protein